MDIQDYINIQTPYVRKNSVILSASDIDQDFMLHIDVKTPRYFYPRISEKQAASEDKSVPRITVAPTLVGCIIGYAIVHGDIRHLDKGAYYDINKFDFTTGIKPNHNLVYDARATSEVWLVTYNEATFRYKPTTIGKLLINKITNTRHSGNKVSEVYEGVVWIKSNDKVRLDYTGRTIEKGYYKIVADLNNLYIPNISKITKSDFDVVKKDTTSMESLKPNYGEW